MDWSDVIPGNATPLNTVNLEVPQKGRIEGIRKCLPLPIHTHESTPIKLNPVLLFTLVGKMNKHLKTINWFYELIYEYRYIQLYM